ncbi:MAG: sigma-70 family RNA polymerase sigma factor [Planctomycetota bacterium]|nr:sigma-70 family RNA polymerase sigma factor [Planctomycetota bacterium]
MSQHTLTESPEITPSPEKGDPVGIGWSGLEEHRTTLRRYLKSRCVDENDIHDIIQESFLRAARYRRVPMDRDRLRGWLMRIASNVQVDKVRSRAKGPTTGLPQEIWETVGERVQEEARFPWGEGELRMGEALQCLEQASHEMRPQDRRVLTEFYLQRSGTEQIAERLGVSPSMVKVRLFRARRRLKVLLEKRFRNVIPPTVAWA